MRDALPRLTRVLTLERAIQLAIVATVVTAVLAAGALLSWLEPARKLRWAALLILFALSLVAARRVRARAHPASTYAAAAGLCALLAVGVAAVFVFSALLTRLPKPLDTPPADARPATSAAPAWLKPRLLAAAATLRDTSARG